MTIHSDTILNATNKFIRRILRLGNNISVVQLNIRTIEREETLSGVDALMFDELLQLKYNSRIVMFKIEKIEGESNGRKPRRPGK